MDNSLEWREKKDILRIYAILKEDLAEAIPLPDV